MTTRTYRLKLRSPLHIGERGIGIEGTLEHLPSDSLFSALAVAWMSLPNHAPIVGQLATEFATEPPLLLTSAFPFVAGVHLMPRPQSMLQPDHVQQNSKLYKRVRWVSAALFQLLATGPSPKQLNTLWNEGKNLVQDGTAWVTAEEMATLRSLCNIDDEGRPILWELARVPRAVLDRVHTASTLFHVGRVHFAMGGGLWFAARADDEWQARLVDGLSLLADLGIGGQRSRGHGQFELEIAEREPAKTVASALQAGSYGCLLSRMAPTPGQFHLLRQPHSAYQLSTVGGFTGTPGDSPLVRKQVRMLAEGSIIAAGEGPPGSLVDVTPDQRHPGHRILRYGYGFLVPIEIGSQEIVA